MKKITLFAVAITAGLFFSCEKITVEEKVGSQPDSDPDASITLRARNSADNVIRMELISGQGTSSAFLSAQANYPTFFDRNVNIETKDEDYVEKYSKENKITYQLLPKPFYEIVGGGSMVIRSGAEATAPKEVKIFAKNPVGNILEPGRYLLPIGATSLNGSVTKAKVLLDISVRERYSAPEGVELYKGEDMFTVFYINTSQFDPRLANDIVFSDYTNPAYGRRGVGNIVNLLTSNVDYDENTGRVSLKPVTDLQYILDHASVRIRPVQESGRKVCITIEGSGGKGIGFCNFTDEQIRQFTVSVLRVVDEYGLDGVNLWDRKSGYGKEGMPPVNTTSYPKLIKSLREALGPFRLLTLTDYEEPTAYFDDVEAMGGIRPGDYLDYAWSGYYDNGETFQIVDPWHQDLSYVSKLHPRRPIAGLSYKRYGCVHDTVRLFSDPLHESGEAVKPWAKAGYYNGIFVFYELRSIIQDKYEGQNWNPIFLARYLYDNSYLDVDIRLIANRDPVTGQLTNQYNKWGKDW